MKTVITGANGQLGQELQQIYPEAKAFTREDLDISDAEQVAGYDWSNVELILNAAAYTNVDEAETQEGWNEAWAANALGVAALAAVAREKDIRFVNVSTDYVFDGTKEGEYKEDDPVNPMSGYGRSKVAGEMAVFGDKQINVRTSWVIGKGSNFVRTMHDLSQKFPELTVVDDQHGRPTFAKDLAEAIQALVEAEAHGTYHFSNSGEIISWYDLTKALLKGTYSSSSVSPTSTEEFSENRDPWAPRPKNSAFDLSKISEIYQPRDWREALQEYIKEELSNESS